MCGAAPLLLLFLAIPPPWPTPPVLWVPAASFLLGILRLLFGILRLLFIFSPASCLLPLPAPHRRRVFPSQPSRPTMPRSLDDMEEGAPECAAARCGPAQLPPLLFPLSSFAIHQAHGSLVLRPRYSKVYKAAALAQALGADRERKGRRHQSADVRAEGNKGQGKHS